MAADKNFTLKITLAEANAARRAFQAQLAQLNLMTLRDMTDEQREDIGHLEKMLRIDF